MNIPEAAITAILGYVVVFFGLALLMAVIVIVGRIMVSVSKKSAAAPASAPAAPAPAAQSPAAPGSAGSVSLYDVPDKEAAMLMAIVADQIGKPLNELRFKSIKEVK